MHNAHREEFLCPAIDQFFRVQFDQFVQVLDHFGLHLQTSRFGIDMRTTNRFFNDPIDQLNRFLEQQNMRDAGDEEAMMLDIDYVEMLEYGMPPACGWGFSERVFWIFEGVTAREGVPFPQLRSDVDDVTKGIYPNVFKDNN